MLSEAQVREDLSRFADLDSDFLVSDKDGDWIASFSQNGISISLTIDRDGKRVIERRDGVEARFSTYAGLLMSPGFGNLQRLALTQVAALHRDSPYIRNPDGHLPIVGSLESYTEARESGQSFLERIEQWLTDDIAESENIKALVVDGPAGIGKTHLIRRLSYDRAANYGPGSAPPLLHLQSRGRKLTTLNDVLAFTLNELRLPLTFFQIPVLAKYGLLHIALDGFDELADPYGYEHAWGSVLDFAKAITGKGVLILAGRDTFIDVRTVRRALPILNEKNTSAAHLRALRGGEAIDWLQRRGWSESNISQLRQAGLLDEESYALRPFFISELARLPSEGGSFEEFLGFPLRVLISKILSREVQLLEPFLALREGADLRNLLDGLFQEIARFISDAETDRIDVANLQLLSELVFAEWTTDEGLAVLRFRIPALVLLEQESADTRKFSHSEIHDYFLGENYISLLSRNEISKSLKRNILGTDLLETFHDLISYLPANSCKEFFAGARKVIDDVGLIAQEGKNVAALLLAASHRLSIVGEPFALTGFALDEVALRGEVSDVTLKQGTISLLDARGCDFSKVVFDDVQVATLLADDATRAGASCPTPFNLQVVRAGRVNAIFDPTERDRWIGRHRAAREESGTSPEWDLLIRLCRVILRQNWIREVEDDMAGKLLRQPEWPKVRDILEQHELLQIRQGVHAAGPRSNFYRIHRAEEFLQPESDDSIVQEIRRELT
ncbi:MAG TPA: hypothetical protein VEA60_12330 [Allosphingosinicella sp.]|nr:hypothetical protein [Allosphingosinicella sp.]